ncbi:MAG: peptidase M64 [Bacteroidetes bacterium HGW-Bacteroidetes-7]|jgi:hypothetical protein|nr:MAG: peptidase M64 [Bacteroidetes bacterium HGW-Bacteroidetes-7]
MINKFRKYIRVLALFIILFITGTTLYGGEDFDSHFTGQRLRLDVIFAGDAYSQSVFLEELHKEPYWSGPRENLTDPFNYGEYKYSVIDSSGKVIFSKGFNNLFQEWRTTAEAKNIKKAFNGSYHIPYPRERVTVIFYERLKESGDFSELGRFPVDPDDKLISSERQNTFKTDTILYNGDPANKLDILFIAEGYTQDEMDKFRDDALRFSRYLFDIEPYKSRKSDINIWALKSLSNESGTDIPHKDIWKNTVLSSNFYTFRIDRYLTAPNHKIVASAASNSHFDAMYVIVNTDIYGGGGIFNFYGLSMADHQLSAAVFVHELGHSLAGLGDEYYSSAVAYEDFYNLKTEPWEPNLTTLVDFDSKWRDKIPTGTPIPTPNEDIYKGVTGLFEGGGYMSKGIYRPYLDCRMKSNTAERFCPVCTEAINRMIDFYAGKAYLRRVE